MSDFLPWWFETHYVLSTILTPFWTWLWLLFTDGSGWREACCVLCWLIGLSSFASRS